jgi:uncharacterized membrane protein HdeD (DUF308 family)
VLMNPATSRARFDRADAEGVAHYWPFLLLGGLISVVFGALILTIDWSVESLGTFIGVMYILQGLSLALTRPLDGSGRGANLAGGALAAAAGIALIVWPDKGIVVVGVFVGIFIVSYGLLHIVGSLANRHVPYWWLMLVLGLIEVPIGIWALRRPGLTIAVIVTLVGAWAVVYGIWQCVMAFEVRNLPRRLGATGAPRTET